MNIVIGINLATLSKPSGGCKEVGERAALSALCNISRKITVDHQVLQNVIKMLIILTLEGIRDLHSPQFILTGSTRSLATSSTYIHINEDGLSNVPTGN